MKKSDKSIQYYFHITISKSWTEHIGKTFADMTYPTDPVTSINGTYIDELEETWNEMTNHIPIGLYHDLIDGKSTNEIAYDFDNLSGSSVIIDDNVIGISNSEIFSLLNSNVSSISDFKNALISSGYVQSPNTTTDVNNLFSSY